MASFAYDGLNRPLTKSYSGGVSTPAVSWVWDTVKLGKLTSVESGNANSAGGSKTTFGYDAAGRMTTSTQRTEGVDYPFEYRYHKGWGLRQVQYPSGRWVRYTPDAAERTVSIERLTSGEAFEKAYWSGAQYAPQGALKQVALGNGLMEKWSFNLQRQQPYGVRLGTAGNDGSHLKLQFAYCANQYSGASCATNNGNILAQWNYETNHIEKYGYDALNRLSSATDFTAAPNGWSQSYSYDRFGNRWISANGALPMDSRTPTLQSDIDAANNRLTGSNYGYDAAGNQTKHGGWTLSYDAENRLVSSLPNGGVETTFSYDGEGRRVKKTTNGVSTWFVYSAMGELAAEYLVSTPSSALVTQFVTTDHLGSTRLVTDASGNVVSRHDYLPFGEELPAGYGGRTAAMKYVANPALTQRFAGKERDTETGLDYFGARYMSAAQGRFTSPDKPLMDQHIADPQSWNLYSYVRNNPLRFVDPSGERIELIGDDEEARKKALATLTAGLSKEAASHVRIDTVTENGKTHYYVGVDSGLKDFAKFGGTAAGLADLIGAKPTVEFGVTDQALPGKGAAEAAYTYAPGEIGNQNVRVLVNPRKVNDASVAFSTNGLLRNKFGPGLLRDTTPTIAAWHEMGHVWGMWQDIQARTSGIPGASGIEIGSASQQKALQWENRMREALYGPLGRNNAERRQH